jgi:hypothetical protein
MAPRLPGGPVIHNGGPVRVAGQNTAVVIPVAIWINPHLKGPDDKPLRTGETVQIWDRWAARRPAVPDRVRYGGRGTASCAVGCGAGAREQSYQ